jgi:hypothetical protein
MSTALTEIPGWYIEFQAALLRQAPRPGEIDQTAAEGWTNNQKSLKKNLSECLLPPTSVTIEPPKPTPSILELVSTVVVPATTSKFVAKEKFVVNTNFNAPVKISAVWDNFNIWFLSGSGKIEYLASEQKLRYHKLRKSSVDGPIIAELGGAEKSETTLSEMFSLMEKQKNGEYGVLLNNDHNTNIFYIRDQNNVLCAVSVYWDGDGWDVDADLVERPRKRRVGYRVFSRNSVLKSSEPLAPAQA